MTGRTPSVGKDFRNEDRLNNATTDNGRVVLLGFLDFLYIIAKI